ncbi:MAG: amino acid aminotransferase [Acholeplasmataceae bacterium]|nr:amino acid aminotransferase [Acholeplasmataceae bacterium]
MIKDLILVNGEILERSKAVIAFGDRGQQFGDGVFELVPVYNGRCFALLPHMESLFASVMSIKIPGIYTVEELVEFHEGLIAATGLENGEIYTQVTRGHGNGGLAFPDMMVPQLTMFAVEKDRTCLQEVQEKGVNVITEPDQRWQRCDINSLNRLPEVLAKQKAIVGKAFETLFVRDTKITEAVEGNLMVVKDEIIWTHPANNLIHNTIAGRLVKERLVPDMGMQVLEKACTVDFALGAEEVFLVGPHYEVVPVTKIDRKFVANKQVGAVTKKIQAAFKNFIAKECPKK